MSIEIITISGYKTKFPDTSLNGIRDARIQSAINLSFSYLDIKTGCAISQRWEIEEPTTGYLTDEQKEYVRQAMYVETQYVLSNNMDFSQGADQSSFGSLSVSSSRPERVGKEVCESALMYLQKAGLYDYLSFSSPSYLGNVNEDTIVYGTSSVDPTSQYVTYTVGDSRYVLAYKDPTIYGGKLLKVNDKGYIEYVDVSGIISSNFYTKAQCDELFVTYTHLEENYYTQEQCLELFYTIEDATKLDARVQTIEKDYATETRVKELETQLASKVSSTSEKNKVYGTDGNGTYNLFNINVDTNAYTIAYRNGDGQINCADPTTNTNAVTLKYFNEHLPTETVVYHIELTGTSGTLTSEQLTTLASGNPTNNYIVVNDNTILKCVYYVSGSRAIYSLAGTNNVASVDITLPAGNWTYQDLTFAVDSEVVKTSGDQSITGIKNFATNLQVSGQNVAREEQVLAKQDKLVSGTNIKTINGNTILGSGDITITGEPSAYLKSASVSTNTLTLTNKDSTVVTYIPTGFEQTSNKTTEISSSSTDGQYPSAKAVYTYIQSLNANETKY